MILTPVTGDPLTYNAIYQQIRFTLPRTVVTIRTTRCKGKVVNASNRKVSCVRFEEELWGRGVVGSQDELTHCTGLYMYHL